MRISQQKGRRGKGGCTFRYELAFMRKVVQDYLSGNESGSQVSARYNISRSCLEGWVKRCREGKEPFDPVPLPAMPSNQSQTDQTDLQKQNEELLKKLEQANMKITGLEIMIDIAEEQLGIEIRKKSGTRQS
jgi:transposase